MGIDRRTALRLLAGGLLAGGTAGLPLSAIAAARRLYPENGDGAARPEAGAAATGRLYLGAGADAAGSYRAGGFRASGAPAFDLRLPGRGHSFAVRPDRRTAVLFARRPGRFALAIDLDRGAVSAEFTTPRDRHFYGHGVFSRDGRFLYASENDLRGERGVIGVYDADRHYRRAGEIASHGIGPHEIGLLSDGATLVVANGGILTRPDLPRVKLNIATMAPSLCYVRGDDGRLVQECRLAPSLHQLGIRHLAVGRDDTVAVAMQYEGPRGDLAPLAALHRPGGTWSAPVRLLEAPAAVWRAMKQYCGSVCFDSGGRFLAVSAPRGDLATLWDVASGVHVSSARVRDGSGVAPGERPGEFLASSGRGGVTVINAWSGEGTPVDTAFVNARRWDNHLTACPD